MKGAHSLGIQGRGVLQAVGPPEGLLVDQDQSWVLDRGSQVGPIQEILDTWDREAEGPGVLRRAQDSRRVASVQDGDPVGLRVVRPLYLWAALPVDHLRWAVWHLNLQEVR